MGKCELDTPTVISFLLCRWMVAHLNLSGSKLTASSSIQQTEVVNSKSRRSERRCGTISFPVYFIQVHSVLASIVSEGFSARNAGGIDVTVFRERFSGGARSI